MSSLLIKMLCFAGVTAIADCRTRIDNCNDGATVEKPRNCPPEDTNPKRRSRILAASFVILIRATMLKGAKLLPNTSVLSFAEEVQNWRASRQPDLVCTQARKFDYTIGRFDSMRAARSYFGGT